MKEKIGILYYSLSGHTKKIAEEIKAVTGGDLIPISTAKVYPSDYEELVEKGQEEVEKNIMPALVHVPSLSAYTFLFAGSPTWWYTMAPAMRSFLAGGNLAGKKWPSSLPTKAGRGGDLPAWPPWQGKERH